MIFSICFKYIHSQYDKQIKTDICPQRFEIYLYYLLIDPKPIVSFVL